MKTATNPQTGERLVLYDGAWTPIENSATDPNSGQKAYKVGGKWVIDQGGTNTPQRQQKASSLLDKIKGVGEAALSIGTANTTGLAGRLGGEIGGIAASVTTGKYGTQEGANMAAQTGEEGAQKYTYEPKTQEGKDALAFIGKLFDQSKLAGLGPTEAVELGNATQGLGTYARAATGDAARRATGNVQKFIGRQPAKEMVGVGSAMSDAETLRRQRAADLPVPIKLTKGQASRTFEQQQFERETAKNPTLGEPLRQRFAEQNQKILQNFDNWVDQTGAEAGGLRATGEAVTKAVVEKSNKAKAQIRAAYTKAKASGDMQGTVNVGPIQQYLKDHQAEAINAPVLKSVEQRLFQIANPKTGEATLNDLEELRKMVGRISSDTPTNQLFGREVKGVIDGMTEGKGGQLYKQARALRVRYAQEFEDHAVVNKLLSFKPGTKDRAVAYEDVFNHSILKGSLDDVRQIRRTLQTAGPEGQQAWKELQGATLRHIRDEITNNVQIDQAGRNVVSPAKLNRLVTELDKDGKLDFVFGKQGAQQIRDINGIAQDVLTSPPGSVNHSNTSSVLLMMLDKLADKTLRIPFVGAATGYAAKEWKNAGIRKQVKDALQ